MTSKRRPLIILGLVLLVAVGAFAAVRVLGGGESRLQSAVALAPEQSERLVWTDWSAIREEVGVEVGPEATTAELRTLLRAGFDADLTSTSALRHSAVALHERYGISPANLDWELLAQSQDGQLFFLGLPPEHDLEVLEDTLSALGYTAPDNDQPNWHISIERLLGIGELTAEFRFLQVDHDLHALVASEDPAYLREWRSAQRGNVADGVSDVVDGLVDPVSAVVYSGDHVCRELAMVHADSADRARADQLLAAAGRVHPLRGFAMAAVPGGDVEVLMAFEDASQARADADVRAQLAVGPAPGQGRTFPDRFTLGDVTADGRLLRMETTPTDGAYVISDLSSGPLLFATC